MGVGVALQDETDSHRQMLCEVLERRCLQYKDTRISESELKKKQKDFLYISITILYADWKPITFKKEREAKITGAARKCLCSAVDSTSE